MRGHLHVLGLGLGANLLASRHPPAQTQVRTHVGGAARLQHLLELEDGREPLAGRDRQVAALVHRAHHRGAVRQHRVVVEVYGLNRSSRRPSAMDSAGAMRRLISKPRSMSGPTASRTAPTHPAHRLVRPPREAGVAVELRPERIEADGRENWRRPWRGRRGPDRRRCRRPRACSSAPGPVSGRPAGRGSARPAACP